MAQKIFSRNGVRKNLFSQDVKKDLFLGGEEVVSDFKNHTKKTTTSTMTKSSLMTTKAAAATKKKAGKLHRF